MKLNYYIIPNSLYGEMLKKVSIEQVLKYLKYVNMMINDCGNPMNLKKIKIIHKKYAFSLLEDYL